MSYTSIKVLPFSSILCTGFLGLALLFNLAGTCSAAPGLVAVLEHFPSKYPNTNFLFIDFQPTLGRGEGPLYTPCSNLTIEIGNQSEGTVQALTGPVQFNTKTTMAITGRKGSIATVILRYLVTDQVKRMNRAIVRIFPKVVF
jgi:hypothetical protein